MDKSMYSLILMDDLVRAVDRLAYENNTSRSALINRILAEHLSMVTPQMRIAEVLEEIVQCVDGRGQLQVQGRPSANMLNVRSVIQYKYNPTLRYSVEILVEDGAYTGVFKVVSRSQSKALLSRLTVFFELWAQIETSVLQERKPRYQLRYHTADGRFQRRLEVDGEGELQDTQILGDAIGKFIGVFDEAMRSYFSAEFGVDMQTFGMMQELYERYLNETPMIL